jgi:hypothetical protein
LRAVLLSDATTAEWLKNNFVLSWEKVREPAKVTIDFGNGKKLDRTLAGNTAFYLALPDGTVVDVFPGVYSPMDFQRELTASLELYNEALAAPVAQRDDVIRAAHEKALGMIVKGEVMRVSMAKAFIESPVLKALGLSARMSSASSKSTVGFEGFAARLEDVSKLSASSQTMRDRLLGNPSLSEEERQARIVAIDSQTNVRAVRPVVHLMFRDAVKGLAQPSDLTRTVFGKIHHIDIDDPYLGLGDNLLPGTGGG